MRQIATRTVVLDTDGAMVAQFLETGDMPELQTGSQRLARLVIAIDRAKDKASPTRSLVLQGVAMSLSRLPATATIVVRRVRATDGPLPVQLRRI